MAHIQNTGETLFTVETHLTYLQEIGLGEMVTITTQLLQTDNKRMRIFHRMYNDQNDLLATAEMLFLCYNLEAKKVINFSKMMEQSLAALEKEQTNASWTKQAGKGICLMLSLRWAIEKIL